MIGNCWEEGKWSNWMKTVRRDNGTCWWIRYRIWEKEKNYVWFLDFSLVKWDDNARWIMDNDAIICSGEILRLRAKTFCGYMKFEMPIRYSCRKVSQHLDGRVKLEYMNWRIISMQMEFDSMRVNKINLKNCIYGIKEFNAVSQSNDTLSRFSDRKEQ